MHVLTQTHARTHTHARAHTHAHTHTHTHTHTHKHTHTQTHTHTHARTHARTHAHTYSHTQTQTCTRTHVLANRHRKTLTVFVLPACKEYRRLANSLRHFSCVPPDTVTGTLLTYSQARGHRQRLAIRHGASMDLKVQIASVSCFCSMWYRSAQKGPYALRPASQQCPQGCPWNNDKSLSAVSPRLSLEQ